MLGRSRGNYANGRGRGKGGGTGSIRLKINKADGGWRGRKDVGTGRGIDWCNPLL